MDDKAIKEIFLSAVKKHLALLYDGIISKQTKVTLVLNHSDIVDDAICLTNDNVQIAIDILEHNKTILDKKNHIIDGVKQTIH